MLPSLGKHFSEMENVPIPVAMENPKSMERPIQKTDDPEEGTTNEKTPCCMIITQVSIMHKTEDNSLI